ncbi:MAG: hypothetical protein JNJ58_11195 [Chitinophagaceae bacterium]|nr:hypothetical protein [Chitinophagaceae bacterium]
MKTRIVKGIMIAAMLIAGISAGAQTVEDGIQLYQYERYESAKKILEPLAAGNPKANYYLGLCQLAEENVQAAKATFQKFPEDAANSAGIARALFAENKSLEAMSMLAKVATKAKKKDWTPLKYAGDAITYTDGGDPNVAVEYYKKAMETERTGELYIATGDAYRKMQGGGGNAMTNYEYAETFPATQSIANYKMGNLWYAAKNYDSALAKYARSSDLDPKNPLPFKALADAYYRVKKYKISKENIEKYLNLSDKTTDDQIQYANTLFLAKEYTPAIQKMNELISKGIEKPYMYRVIGFSLYETGDFKNAKMNMDKLFAKQDPKKVIPQDYQYYGKILLKDSTTASQANAAFIKGIDIDTAKDKSAVLRDIAEAYYSLLDYPNAASWYKKIIDTGTPLFEDYWWCGVMYFYAKDYVNAESTFVALSAKYPEEPSCVFWLARIAAASKDKDYTNGAASALFTQWLGLVKDDPSKKKDLIRAYQYLATVAYNSQKKEDARTYCLKIQTFDANDETAKQILKLLEAK